MSSKTSYCEEELVAQLRSWNPMKEDYNNRGFNTYLSGPGAQIEPALQTANPGRSAAKLTPFLFMRQIPVDMTKNAMFNICSQFGRVTSVRDSKIGNYFVDFASMADMEAAYRGLQNNTFGFLVYVGRHKTDPARERFVENVDAQLDHSPETRQSDPFKKDAKVSMENRIYIPPTEDPPRPEIKFRPIVTAEDYDNEDNDLQRNDPQRHYLIEADAHNLERAGLATYDDIMKDAENEYYKFRTGRAYKEMPANMSKKIDEQNDMVAGHYDSERRRFVYASEGVKAPRSGYCNFCGNKCDSICVLCNTFFCDWNCQKKGWFKHRYTCRDIPGNPRSLPSQASHALTNGTVHLDNERPKSANGTNIMDKLPASGSLVSITSVSKTNFVFVRSASQRDNMDFFKLIGEIQSMASTLKKLQHRPKIGEMVVGQFQGNYCRGLVLGWEDEDRVKLVYSDYGNIEFEIWKNLRESVPHLIAQPRCAIPVVLKGVPDFWMTDIVRSYMYAFVKDVNVKMIYTPGELDVSGIQLVELIDIAKNQSFNKEVARLLEPKEPIGDHELCFADYLSVKLLPENDDTKLYIMDNSLLETGLISCTTPEASQEILKFQRELQLYGNKVKPQPYAPRIDELCIAKYKRDGDWYRARCLDLVGDGFPSLTYIDFGNLSIANIEDIRRYPPQFTFPIFTVDCEISGLPEDMISSNLLKRLEQLLPRGKEIVCSKIITNKDKKYHIIHLPKVIDQLRNEGLLPPAKE